MNLYLLRHGYTDENHKQTYYGALNPSLNKKGIEQCKKVKEALKLISFDDVYSSPMARAMETTLIVTEGGKEKKDKRITERNFGIFEGKTYEELQQDNNLKIIYEHWCNDWINYKIPQGESHLQFCHRVYDFMDEILSGHQNHNNVLIVTHAGVIRAIYTYVMEKKPELFWKFASENGDLSLIRYEYGNLFVDYIKHFKER